MDIRQGLTFRLRCHYMASNGAIKQGSLVELYNVKHNAFRFLHIKSDQDIFFDVFSLSLEYDISEIFSLIPNNVLSKLMYPEYEVYFINDNYLVPKIINKTIKES